MNKSIDIRVKRLWGDAGIYVIKESGTPKSNGIQEESKG